MSASDKIIYSPAGEREVHTFANAYDLLAHAGYTVNPPTDSVDETVEDATDDADDGDSTDDSDAGGDNEASERPDFAAMTKVALEDYARTNYGVEIDKRKSQATLAAEVTKLFDEHNAE